MAQKQYDLLLVLKSNVTNFDAGMKSASKSFSSFGKATKSIGSSLVGLGAFAGISVGIVSAIDKIKNFEAALSSLSAITGATGKDLKFYEQAAISTSKKTLQSATDIVKAYEKVGSASPILLKNKEALAKVAEQAIILSEASGGQLGLDGAIEAVTASMNQFGIAGEDSARIINTLAAGSLEGSASVATIAEAMKNVGTVAKDSNMSLEQTVAALEVLGEKQIMGAEAGTKLRGALLKMKEAGIGYASGQFDLNDAITEANKKLSTYGTQLEKDAYKSKLFGAENITVGSILLANKDKYNQLTAAVTGTNVAMDQQRIQNDNLKGDLAKLSTTYDAFVVSLNSGNGAISKSIRYVTQAFTGLIDQLAGANKSMEEIKGETQLNNIATAIAHDKDEIAELTKRFSEGRTSAEAYAKALETVKQYAESGLMNWNTSAETEVLNARIAAIKRIQDEQNKALEITKAQATVTTGLKEIEQGSIPNLEYAVDLVEKRKMETSSLIDLMKEYSKLDFNKGIERPTDLTVTQREVPVTPDKEVFNYFVALGQELKNVNNLAMMFNSTIGAMSTAFEGLFSGAKGGFKDVVTSMLGGIQMIINGLLAEAIAAMIAREATKGLLGLATAALGVSLLMGLWKSKVPEFAMGGIVGGNSFSGDRVPALVNSGEMILNRGQQRNLFGMINGGGGNMGLSGRLYMEGTQLVALIETVVKKQNSIR